MKKIFLLVTFFLSISTLTYSQSEKVSISTFISNSADIEPIMEFAYGGGTFWQLADVELKTFIARYGLKGSYAVNENQHLRIKLGMTIRDGKHSLNSDNNTIKVEYGQTFKHKVFSVYPGFTWSLKNKNIKIVGGVEVPVHFVGSGNSESYRIESDSNTGDIWYNATNKSYGKGGLLYGVGSFLNLNYYLSRNFSIGSEMSFSLLHASLGGEAESIDTYDGNTVITKYDQKIKKTLFSGLDLDFNLTYSF